MSELPKRSNSLHHTKGGCLWHKKTRKETITAMATFFRENRSEVTKSMVLDYTWERREELIRAEEYEDGKREGLEIGRAEGEKATQKKLLQNLMETQRITETEARQMLGIR